MNIGVGASSIEFKYDSFPRIGIEIIVTDLTDALTLAAAMHPENGDGMQDFADFISEAVKDFLRSKELRFEDD